MTFPALTSRRKPSTTVTSSTGEIRIRMGAMRIQVQPTVVALVCGLALCASRAQENPRAAGNSPASQQPSVNGKNKQKNGRSLSSDDRLSVIAAALDSRGRHSEHDCSHLVHAIYEQAGFPYQYASSDDLYLGTEAFQQIKRPEPGDLVVWRGHVGIVIRPSRHVFFSFLSTGPGTDDYQAPYWRSRGRPRFYRYVRNDSCPRCVPVRGRPTVIR